MFEEVTPTASGVRKMKPLSTKLNGVYLGKYVKIPKKKKIQVFKNRNDKKPAKKILEHACTILGEEIHS